MEKTNIPRDGVPPDTVEALILANVKQLKYGEIKVTVHDSRVVQLETTNKIRFKLGKEPEAN